jgi:C1A family cysteine protease
MADRSDRPAMGWLPDYPDFRDHTPDLNEVPQKLRDLGEKDSVRAMLRKVGVAEPSKVTAPAAVDLREWCSPVEDQGSIGSCTAHAGVGVLEYFERRAFGRHIDASRLFLYKTTRNLLHWTGDTGAFLRSAIGAMVLFGVPPEEYWPYNEADYEKEPTGFCYAFAQNFQAITYYRLDQDGVSPSGLLDRIKANLAGGLPSLFGFTVYASYAQAAATGKIPFPAAGEKIVGGHAVVAVGYDDAMKVKNTSPKAKQTTGALLIRNSWGAGWGAGGYGWLPYEYVLRGLALDWWSLLKNAWIDTGQFKA